MSAYDQSRRYSQWDAPIPVASSLEYDQYRVRSGYAPSYKPSRESLDSFGPFEMPRDVRPPSLVSPLGGRYDFTERPAGTAGRSQAYCHPSFQQGPPPNRSWTFDSQISEAPVLSAGTSPPSPDPHSVPAEPRQIRPSPSPASSFGEQQPTRADYLHSHPSASSHERHFLSSFEQPDIYEKEVVPSPADGLYPVYSVSPISRTASYSPHHVYSQSPDASIPTYSGSAPLAYTDSSLAYSDTTLAYTETGYPLHPPSDMNFFRRKQSKALRPHPSIADPPDQSYRDGRQQSELPARTAYDSINIDRPQPPAYRSRTDVSSTDDEKLSLGPQDTGIVHADGEIGFGYGVQDEEKQSLQPYDHSITSQIALARSQRIRAVVDAYVEPLLREQAANGIASTTLVLVPEVAANSESVSDYSAALSSTSPSEKGGTKQLDQDVCRLLSRQEASDFLIGFPAELALRVVRLSPTHSGHTGHSGDDRSRYGDQGSRFWQQPPVVTELDRLLRIRLVDMGLDVHDPTGATAAHRRDGWTQRGEMVGAKLPAAADVKAKKKASAGGAGAPWHGDHWDAGAGIWQTSGKDREKASWQTDKKENLMPGQASVKVDLQDVCFRTQSPMGLYETRTDQAVVVGVRIEV